MFFKFRLKNYFVFLQDSVINGFIPANLTSQLRSSLKAGSIVRLDGFEVDRIPHMYKITEHQFVIRFISSTRIDEVFADGPVIKSDKFMVRRIDHLQVLANTNLELSGVFSFKYLVNVLKEYINNIVICC